jgi:hypothetical protein
VVVVVDVGEHLHDLGLFLFQTSAYQIFKIQKSPS